MANKCGNMETVTDFIFLGSKISADGACSHKIKRHLLLRRKAVTNLDSILKSRDITLPTKVHLVKAMVFPIVMYGCESWTIKKGWMPKKWCFWAVLLEKTLESPLDYKEMKPVNPKGNQSWIFTERTDAEAPILWPPDVKSQLIRKNPDAGEDWGRRRRGRQRTRWLWHHRLKGQEFEQNLGDGEGQGSLACSSPWNCKELIRIEQLNNNKPLLNIHSNGIKYICFAVWSYHYPSTELFSSCKTKTLYLLNNSHLKFFDFLFLLICQHHTSQYLSTSWPCFRTAGFFSIAKTSAACQLLT